MPEQKRFLNSLSLGLQPHAAPHSVNLDTSRSMVVFHHEVTLPCTYKPYQCPAAVRPVAAQADGPAWGR